MLDRNHRICPNCGERLFLSEPCLEVTDDVDISNGMAVYSCSGIKPMRGNRSYRRILRYTSRREKSLPIVLDGSFGARGVECPVSDVRQRLSKDKLFHPLNVMYCKSCKARIALNRNPLRIFDDITSFVLLAVVLVLFVCSFTLRLTTLLMWSLGLSVAAYIVYVLWAIGYWLYIKKCCSNFVALDFTLRPMNMSTDIIAEVEKPSVYFIESNIFEAVIDNKTYYFYVISCKENTVEFHILGNEIPSNFSSEITLNFENRRSFRARIINH